MSFKTALIWWFFAGTFGFSFMMTLITHLFEFSMPYYAMYIYGKLSIIFQLFVFVLVYSKASQLSLKKAKFASFMLGIYAAMTPVALLSGTISILDFAGMFFGGAVAGANVRGMLPF
jgi:hypothetical protein